MEEIFSLHNKEVLDVLRKRVVDFGDGYRQNIALLGEELFGKTTLLKNFLAEISGGRLVTVYVEVVAQEFHLFLKRFLNSLFFDFLRRQQLISSRESLENLINRLKGSLPQTAALAEGILGRMRAQNYEALFKELFVIVETFCRESGRRLLIVLDEFHCLKDLEVKNISQELGLKVMFLKNVLFIFSSSSKKEARKILNRDLSLLFGNFETIELTALDAAHCASLIHNRLTGVSVSKDFIDFLIHFTGGHPFYLKIICDEAGQTLRLAGQTVLTKEVLAVVLEGLLFEEWGTFNLKFTRSLPGRGNGGLVCLLAAVAVGYNRLSGLAAYLRCPKPEAAQKLNRLIELELISKSGSFYSVCDRVMNFWLKFVHFEKLNSLAPDCSEQTAHFRLKVRAEIDEFIQASNKAVADRLLDLFGRFEGDDIQIEKRRFELTSFKELKILSFEEENVRIGIFGKAQGVSWLAAIKEDGIKEEDMRDLLKIAQRFKDKTINKIMIGLGGIDRNAKLLAKEARIMTWDVAHINHLFDLYARPRIIR